LVGAQSKQDSGACIDAQAWLAGAAATSSLVAAQVERSPFSQDPADAWIDSAEPDAARE
jgi:hypothetical protein